MLMSSDFLHAFGMRVKRSAAVDERLKRPPKMPIFITWMDIERDDNSRSETMVQRAEHGKER
jgi:hypothetical protein